MSLVKYKFPGKVPQPLRGAANDLICHVVFVLLLKIAVRLRSSIVKNR